MSDTILISFKAITSFTNALAELFADRQRSLKLYCHLISKTTLAHEKAIEKHVSAFREFCMANREALADKDVKKLNPHRIEYSNKAYIDLKSAFKMADAETKNVMWTHLLTISALVDPLGKAKELLKQKVPGKEGDFLANIISRVEQNIDPNNNDPMQAISSIMKSGIFTDLIGGLQSSMDNGEMDIGKLMSSVQQMVSSIDCEEGEEGSDSMNIINTMMNSMGAMSNMGGDEQEGTPPGMPDLSAMLGPLMGALNGGGNNSQEGAPNFSAILGPLMGALNNTGGQQDLSNIMMSVMSNGQQQSIEERIESQVSSMKGNPDIEEIE